MTRPRGDKHDWTLVTVTHNSAQQLKMCWEEVPTGARWIVVDNNSTDGSASLAEDLGAAVIPLKENIGFGRANNVGLSHVTTPWLAFVNPDVVVSQDGGLERLALTCTDHSALVSPQLLNPDGTEQPNARGLPFLVDKIANRSVPLPGARLQEYTRTNLRGPTYAAWTMGAAVAGSTQTFRDLGGWDERYFIYYEDHDLGLRAWRRGVPVILDPSVRWSHSWARATTRARFGPWKHELASMRTFYSTYPELLTRNRLRRRGGQFGRLEELLWTTVR